MPTKTSEGSLHVAGVGEGVSSGIADLIVGHAAGHERWRPSLVAAKASPINRAIGQLAVSDNPTPIGHQIPVNERNSYPLEIL